MGLYYNQRFVIESQDDRNVTLIIYPNNFNNHDNQKGKKIEVIKDVNLDVLNYRYFIEALNVCIKYNNNIVTSNLSYYLDMVVQKNKDVRNMDISLVGYAVLLAVIIWSAITPSFSDIFNINKEKSEKNYDPKKVYMASFTNLSFIDFFSSIYGYRDDNRIYDINDYQKAISYFKQVYIDSHFDVGDFEVESLMYILTRDHLSAEVFESLKKSEITNNDNLYTNVGGLLIRMHRQGLSLCGNFGSTSIDNGFFKKLSDFRNRIINHDDKVGQELSDLIVNLKEEEVSSGALFIANWELNYLLDLALGSRVISADDYLTLKNTLNNLDLTKYFMDSNKYSTSHTLVKNA